MAKSIFLRGKISGYIRFETSGGSLRYRMSGLPRDAHVYIVDAKERPIPADTAGTNEIRGVIITDDEGKIIAEGRAAYTGGTNTHAKLGLPQTKVKNERNNAPHSAALDEIIERMERVFSAPEAERKDEAAHKQAGFNPFSEMYPDAVWKKVGNGSNYRLTGRASVAGQVLFITAIPAGAYSDAAFAREGFSKVARADDGTVYRMKVERRRN